MQGNSFSKSTLKEPYITRSVRAFLQCVLPGKTMLSHDDARFGDTTAKEKDPQAVLCLLGDPEWLPQFRLYLAWRRGVGDGVPPGRAYDRDNSRAKINWAIEP
jgi:hypothetical protein